MLAGQTSWQRPHSVQEYESSSCFQLKSKILPAPKRSMSSIWPLCSAGMGRSVPDGLSERKNTLGAAVITCRCLENGRYVRNVRKISRWLHQATMWITSSVPRSIPSIACAMPYVA